MKQWRLACLAVLLTAGPPAITSAFGQSHGAPLQDLLATKQLAAAAYHDGRLVEAASHWKEAARMAAEANKADEEADALLRLAQVDLLLGAQRDAFSSADRALTLARRAEDQRRIARALAGVGAAYAAAGKTDFAYQSLNEALPLARNLADQNLFAAVLEHLAALQTSQAKYTDALATYRESLRAARESGDPFLRAHVATNAAAAALEAGQPAESLPLLEEATAQLQLLEASHEHAFALIAIARLYQRLPATVAAADAPLRARSSALLTQAASMADTLGDRRAAAYAWGDLGALYEQEHRYAEALQLTRRAVFAAQSVSMPESLYRWHWQTGRLLRAQGNTDDAITAYRIAVDEVRLLRPRQTQPAGARATSFDESVKPVYLELVDLLLQRAAVVPDRAQQQAALMEARTRMESFKVAELEDYFRDTCVDASRSQVAGLDTISPTVAVLYTIVLPDRIELLINLPSGLKRASVPVGAEQLTSEVHAFRRQLESRRGRNLEYAQTLYNWLIRPLDNDLSAFNIDTLVFVPSGALLSIPMAALHDGQQFLINKYAIAITPALTLTDPRPFPRDSAKLLLLGLTESVQGFPPLQNVEPEMQTLKELYPATVLLNEDFRVPRILQAMQTTQFNLVHIASHGEFGTDVDDTFVLTFDGKLSMQAMDQWVGQFKNQSLPLELLTLSACETAAGDDRAALGLAGVAVRAGAKSALASLWAVEDRAALLLVTEFYQQLHAGAPSKAVALQRAQVKLLQDPHFSHPGYWSPFLLINNWL
jgi:CHAT domain-containing protein